MFKDEAELEEFCCDYAHNEYGIANLKIEKIRKGLPDRLFFRRYARRNAVIFAVEFKDLGEEASKFQKQTHEIFTLETGVPVYVVDCATTFARIINEEVYA